MSALKITFVGDFLYNCGSSQTLIEYFKVANRQGLQLRVSGFVDKHTSKNVPVLDRVTKNNTDVAIFVFENVMYLDPQKFPKRLDTYLKDMHGISRIVVDTDAKYKLTNSLHGVSGPKIWDTVIDSLTNIVLQPTVGDERKDRNIYPFLFFAFPNVVNSYIEKLYDVSYVGNNWYREDEMAEFLYSCAESKRVKSVSIRGKKWNKLQLELKLRRCLGSKGVPLRLSISKSVMPNMHLKLMSEGSINPVLVNKELLKKHLATPRMFETFAADTVPVLSDSAMYVSKIYGNGSHIFFSRAETTHEKIQDVFLNKPKYIKHRDEVRRYLKAHHSFDERFKQLLKVIT